MSGNWSDQHTHEIILDKGETISRVEFNYDGRQKKIIELIIFIFIVTGLFRKSTFVKQLKFTTSNGKIYGPYGSSRNGKNKQLIVNSINDLEFVINKKTNEICNILNVKVSLSA